MEAREQLRQMVLMHSSEPSSVAIHLEPREQLLGDEAHRDELLCALPARVEPISSVALSGDSIELCGGQWQSLVIIGHHACGSQRCPRARWRGGMRAQGPAN